MALSALFVTLYSYTTSPLYDYDGFDSMIFRNVGQAWLQGRLPYVDTFDNKGPYLFIIQILGNSISNAYGLFLLQILNLAVALELLYRIQLLLRTKSHSWINAAPFALFLALNFILYSRGNSSEEWCLNLALLPMYLFIKNLRHAATFPPLDTAIYGACFGVIFFIRINNGCIIAAIVVTAIILLIRRCNWRLLRQNALAFIGGFAATTLPIIVYFGANGALADMFFCTYGFNAKYMAFWGNYSVGHRLLRACENSLDMLSLILLSVIAYRQCRKRELQQPIALFFILASITTFLAFLFTIGYDHYFIVTLPLSFVMAQLLIDSVKPTWAIAIFALLIAAACVNHSYDKAYQRLAIAKDYRHFNRWCVSPIKSMICSHVPPAQFNQIYSYALEDENAVFLYLAGYPSGKYMLQQREYSSTSQRISNEINEYHHKGNPPYILTTNRLSLPADSSFIEMLHRYEPIDSTNNVILYRAIALSSQ